jgi:DNA processing protein
VDDDGVRQIGPSDAGYPEGLLCLSRPPVLFALGKAELVVRPCIGICGSRSASSNALGYAGEFGYLAAKRGFVVVSGYARGVDVAAHLGTVEAGGATIAVLAEGIESFRVRRELLGKVNTDNFLAISPFGLQAPWTSWRAMERNRYIIGLSRGLFVIEARERSGTFEAGLECLRQRKPLWVIEYEHGGSHREGNTRLIAAGGTPIRSGGVLKKLLEDAWHAYQPRQERLTLSVAES